MTVPCRHPKLLVRRPERPYHEASQAERRAGVRDETGRVTMTISAVPPSRIMRGHDRREPAVKNVHKADTVHRRQVGGDAS